MKKGLLIAGSIAVLCVIAAVVVVRQNNQQFSSGGIKLVRAKALVADTKPCAKSNDAAKLSSQERNSVEMAAISYIIDVPAGTNVDVNVASVTDDTVVGSDIYPAKYGSYNFTLKHVQPDTNGTGWAVTSFKPCKNS
jgi:hypothetical protein